MQPQPARPVARRPRPLRAWAGQGTTEFLLVACVIAVAAVPSMQFLQQMQQSFFAKHQAQMTTSVSDAATTVKTPTASDQCKKGGWGYLTDDGTRFKNQGDCQSYVATGGKNEAAKVPTHTDQCREGGWIDATRADGARFTNQDDCESYVQTGE
jgi:hypothetical protein